MEKFKTKSLDGNVSDQELKNLSCYSASFLSFERAIEQDLGHEKMSTVKGYNVTEYGIEIIYK